MATFSEHFHDRWMLDGYSPREFVDVGYPFDGSFALVHERARARRTRMRQAGAEFVVCFFDESVQDDKYGLVHRQRVRRRPTPSSSADWSGDPTLGLVIKTQFHDNLDRLSPDVAEAMARAERTGRLELPRTRAASELGVLPAEATLSADLAVGHAIGGTASLEAALAGRRSLIVNAYGFRSASDALYARCDIVYPTLDAALEAIDAHRRGDPSRASLGDWSPILPEFDPFRDGRAADSLRKIVEGRVHRRGGADRRSEAGCATWGGGGMSEPNTRALPYFLRHYARLYVVLSLIAAASAAMEAILVAAIYPLLTLVLDARVEGGGRVLEALQRLVDAVPAAHRLAGVLGLFISVPLLLNALLQFLKEWRSAATSGYVAYDVKQRLLRRFVSAPYASSSAHKQGDLTYRLSTASANLSFALYLISSAFSYAPLTALFIVVVLTTIEWRVTAVTAGARRRHLLRRTERLHGTCPPGPGAASRRRPRRPFRLSSSSSSGPRRSLWPAVGRVWAGRGSPSRATASGSCT